MFKAFLSLVTALIISVNAFAQKDVTKFLGIPVDGTKEEMIRQLKEKGFRQSPYDNEVLTGEFNGMIVDLYISTNKGNVFRICVTSPTYNNELEVKLAFNNLCRQFENNSNYLSDKSYQIPDNADIWHEIMINKARFEASYYQAPELNDPTALSDKIFQMAMSKYSAEELVNLSEEERDSLFNNLCYQYIAEISIQKLVWFMIDKTSNHYQILIFYDNKYNQANGEDL